MTKRDLLLVAVIGAAVGLLIQPVLTNTNAVAYIHEKLPVPLGLVRVLVFLMFFALAPVALTVAGYIGRTIPLVYQFAKFAAVGSLNSFIDLGVFNVLTMVWGVPAKELSNLTFGIFKTISFFAATTNSYFWNKAWTFGDRSQNHASTMVKFYALTGLTWLLNVSVATGVKAMGPILGLDHAVWVNVIAPIAGIFSALFGNFLGYKYLVFRNPEQAAERPAA